MLVSQRRDHHPSGLTPNYLPNSTLLVEDKWACFFIELLAKNRVLGNKDYKASAVIRKNGGEHVYLFFLKKECFVIKLVFASLLKYCFVLCFTLAFLK